MDAGIRDASFTHPHRGGWPTPTPVDVTTHVVGHIRPRLSDI